MLSKRTIFTFFVLEDIKNALDLKRSNRVVWIVG